MKLHTHITPPLFLTAALALTLADTLRAQATTPLQCVDRFFEAFSGNADFGNVFSEKAVVTSVLYDSLGNPGYQSFDPAAFREELGSLSTGFQPTQEPVVLVYREYASVASLFCSVWSRFVDRTTSDTIVSRSIQSFKLLRSGDEWKIYHLVIQNEHPGDPFNAGLWPPEITGQLKQESSAAQAEENSFGTYDPTRIYSPEEVDEPPVYPGTRAQFETMLNTNNVQDVAAPGYTAFTVVIAEDGEAGLASTENLGNYQRAKAETFVRSMLLWYPAILDAASVKCKLTFYIRE